MPLHLACSYKPQTALDFIEPRRGFPGRSHRRRSEEEVVASLAGKSYQDAGHSLSSQHLLHRK